LTENRSSNVIQASQEFLAGGGQVSATGGRTLQRFAQLRFCPRLLERDVLSLALLL
jgi:hypothetical protein